MKNVNKTELNQLKLQNQPILVDFYGTWCQPCKLLTPTLESLESENTNIIFVKVDIDQNLELLREYSIQSVPTVLIIQNDELKHRSSGNKPKQFYQDTINEL